MRLIAHIPSAVEADIACLLGEELDALDLAEHIHRGDIDDRFQQ